MVVRLAMMHIDDTDNLAAAYQRNGQKCFVRVLYEGLKTLKARVGGSVLRESDYGTVLHYPPRHAFPNSQAQIAEIALVWNLGRTQHDIVRFALNQINEACVAFRDPSSETNDFAQHLVERELGTDDVTDPMKKPDLGSGVLRKTCGGHIRK